MEIYSEIEKYEMDAKFEQLVPSEEVVPEEVTDTITALVNQAKIISEDNGPIIKPYEGVDNPTTYIDKTEEKRSQARENYSHLQGMKKSHFWTIGRNKAKVERTQEVLLDIIDAVDNNANATKALFNNQIKLAEFSKKLYGIGLMGIASNRIVVNAIKLKLKHASKEEVVDLARRELESLVYELEKQQQLEKKIDDNQKAIKEELDTKIKDVKESACQLELRVDYNQKAFVEKIENISKALICNKEQFETKIQEVKELSSQLELRVGDNQKAFIEIIEDINKALISNKEQFDTLIKEVKETVNQQGKCVDDNFRNMRLITDAHDNRLGILEKKSFLDSFIYKLFVGIAAFGALISSIMSFLA